MDIRKIKTLIEMLEESNLNEIEVSQGEESVRISKSSKDTNMLNDTGIQSQNIHKEITPTDQNQNPSEVKGNLVTSPIVGTFYRKPSPEKEPFVKVGDIVLFGKWSGTDVKIDGKEYSIMKESDIMGISKSKK